MQQQNFEAFAAQAKQEGFDEVIERTWAPFSTLDMHTHPFAFKAVLIRGEMRLTVGSETRDLLPGDEFALDREIPHAERYGSTGASYWVARKN